MRVFSSRVQWGTSSLRGPTPTASAKSGYRIYTKSQNPVSSSRRLSASDPTPGPDPPPGGCLCSEAGGLVGGAWGAMSANRACCMRCSREMGASSLLLLALLLVAPAATDASDLQSVGLFHMHCWAGMQP